MQTSALSRLPEKVFASQLLTADQVRLLCKKFVKTVQDRNEILCKLYDGCAHKALDYPTFGIFCRDELDLDDKQVYYMLECGEFARKMGCYVPNPFRSLLTDSRLSWDQRREIWEKVQRLEGEWWQKKNRIVAMKEQILGHKTTAGERIEDNHTFGRAIRIEMDGKKVEVRQSDIVSLLRESIPTVEMPEEQESIPLIAPDTTHTPKEKVGTFISIEKDEQENTAAVLFMMDGFLCKVIVPWSEFENLREPS